MLRLFLFFSVLVFCSSAAAVPPDHVVYRVDDREPSEIFSNGFRSYGMNAGVDEHVSGASIRNRTSAWIATTDNIDTAVNIANTRYYLMQASRPRTTWIYEIAQDYNMYDMVRIIEHESNSLWVGSARRDHLNALLMAYRSQREIGALRVIQPGQVVRARQFVWDPASGRGQFTGEWIANPHYNEERYRHTIMNSGLYDFSRAVYTIVGWANTALFLAASWCMGQGSSKGKSDDQNICGDSGMIEYTDTEVLMNQKAKANYVPYDL